jgi:hypothetical protein
VIDVDLVNSSDCDADDLANVMALAVLVGHLLAERERRRPTN